MQGFLTSLLFASIAVLSVYPSGSKAQDIHNFRFTHLTTEDGLSQSTINDILQDSRGFLWFATNDGLNRYDGYNFKVFKHDPSDSTSIANNMITGLIEDFDGNIWVATNGGGLNRFDRRNESFEHFTFDRENENSLTNDFVTSLYLDFTGVMLVGTQSGLNIFDPQTHRFRRYQARDMDTGELSHDHITDVTKDGDGMIWIGTRSGGLFKFDRFEEVFSQFRPGDGSGLQDYWITALHLDQDESLWVGTQSEGLYRFNHDTEIFDNFRSSASEPNSISHNWILSIYEDLYGAFWVGTMNGLNLMEKETERFSNISQEQPNYLSNYSISSLYEDKSGVFWIGTRDGALNKLVRTTDSFSVFQHEPGNLNSISENNVWALLESSSGEVWFGTHGGGLNRFLPETGEMKRYRHNPEDSSSLSDNFVNTLIEDKSGDLWIGTINGLNRYDRETDSFIRYKHDPNDPNTIGGNQITALMEGATGEIWIGTLNSGLTSYHPETGAVRRYSHDADDPESLSHNKVWSLFEDSNGSFWLGTHGYGLNRYDRVNDVFTHYKHDPGHAESISSNFINFIHEDNSGQLWIGTLNGLNRFNEENGSFERYTTRNGLPNNVLYGVIEDDRGHLWLSTNNGIADFNPVTGTSRNYGVGDGLPGKEYRFGAYHRGESGRMYFGGIDGAVVFEPDSLRDNPYIPPVRLTNFQIFNEDVPIGDNSFLSRSIIETDEITFSYKETVFSFEYAGLHFAAPEQNQYAYMLDGFDRDWQYVGNRRFTSYTNLPPGHYTFMVKASNKDGIWNETGTSVQLEITPPVWQTWWAYGLYGIMFSVLMAGTVQYRVRKERLKKEKLIQKKKELEDEVRLRTIELAEEKVKGDALLKNILPGDVADQLIRYGKAEPRKYEEVSILFTDFENFTETSSSMAAGRLVNELNEIFEAFDKILERNEVEKIKTIGDSYMAVGGVPSPDPDHARNVIRASLEMLKFIEERNEHSSFKWRMRVGVHSGSIIAGIVGKNKFTYDIWGDSVIIAHRMETTGEPGKINISAVTRDLVKDDFQCRYRGKLSAPGKGKLDMYFIDPENQKQDDAEVVEEYSNGVIA
jgi:ligand-binding sensor domain-containing protein/class 3 adenylate cyclase